MTDSLLSVGFRKAVIYKLNSSGRVAATATTVYTGSELRGSKNYVLNIPEARRISHTGNDRVLAVDQLPSLEPSAGEVRVSVLDYDIDAMLMGQLVNTVGDHSFIGRQTEFQGSEIQVALLLFQQSLDKTTGTRRWHWHIVPSTRLVPIIASFGENAEDHRYTIAPNIVTKHIWGTAFDVLTDGFTESAILDGFSSNKPKLVAFKGDGVEDAFDFEAGIPMANNTYPVWVNGTLQVADVTKTTTGMTFTAPPAADADIIVFGSTVK
jgi:hypothetical protein